MRQIRSGIVTKRADNKGEVLVRYLEPGDYFADITKIKRITGWHPKVDLETGIKRTINYYRKYKKHYWKND